MDTIDFYEEFRKFEKSLALKDHIKGMEEKRIGRDRIISLIQNRINEIEEGKRKYEKSRMDNLPNEKSGDDWWERDFHIALRELTSLLDKI